MTIKISYKEFNLIVHNTDEGFGGLVEDNKVFKVITGKSRFWDVYSYTLPELEVKFKKLVDEKLKEVEKQTTGKLEYLGYSLQIKEVAKDGEIIFYDSICPEFSPNYIFKATNIDELLSNFKNEIDKDKKKPKMSLLDNKGNVVTLPYKVREDGFIECEPFTKNTATIVGFKLEG